MNLDDLRTSSSSIKNEKEKKQSFILFDDLVPSERNKKIYIVKADLTETIRENGLKESFTVQRLKNGKYEILSGNRRYLSIKKLLAEDPEFTYMWVQGSNKKRYSPTRDGIPCKIIERDLDDNEKLEIIMSSNDHRDYDKMEIYHVVMNWKNLYKKKGYEGKLNEKIAENAPIAARTIAEILADKWLINSRNIKDVEKCGSFAEYCKQEAENIKPGKAPMPKPKMDGFNKEYAYQDKVRTHFEKIDFDKLDIKGDYYDDLRKNAKMMIQTIMDAYNFTERDLKR